jgi:hypothetical protein
VHEGEQYRRICGSGVEGGIWRTRTNQELRELYKDLDIAGINKEKIGMD